jgi:hypothetical protein
MLPDYSTILFVDDEPLIRLSLSSFWKMPGTELVIISARQWPSEGDLPPGAAFLTIPCPNEVIVCHVASAAERGKRPFYVAETTRQPTERASSILPFPKTA